MSPEPVCATCELHAEAVFRVEGMDCNEESILECRLKPLDGDRGPGRWPHWQRLHVKYYAAKLTTSAMVYVAGRLRSAIKGRRQCGVFVRCGVMARGAQAGARGLL